MTIDDYLDRISRGRTDLILDLITQPGWEAAVSHLTYTPFDWCVYYDDVTALKVWLRHQPAPTDDALHTQLNTAAFFGHWKICDLLIGLGADPNFPLPETGETALHSALCKAGRPAIIYTVRLLLDHGANPNATCRNDCETEAFMRDVRTRGETPLHRAAAFATPDIISLLLDHSAQKDLKDAHGDTPLSWASWHLRPGSILKLLAHPPHSISDNHVARHISDHGAGWGNGMEWNLMGDYLPLSKKV